MLLTDGDGNRYGVSGSPALCAYRDKLYLVRQGREDSGWMWCAIFDGKTWGKDKLIPSADKAYGVSGSPALCVYRDKLHIVHGGRNDSGYIWWATYDVDHDLWGADQLIPNSAGAYGLSGSPALCVYQDKLQLFHGGRGETGYIWWATYDGDTNQWGTDKLIPSDDKAYGVSDSPAAHVYENHIVLLRQGRKNSGWTWCATFDGKTWQDGLIPNPGYGVTASPAVEEYRGKLYCVRQGRHNDGWVWAGVGMNTLLGPTS
ncbi:MAG TPA: hypothetical protein VG245_01345 [Candidatus Dormibacteraeota bacterium]|nr:hypothetical protein [Candidatus Dormibacteraeota bacterium]